MPFLPSDSRVARLQPHGRGVRGPEIVVVNARRAALPRVVAAAEASGAFLGADGGRCTRRSRIDAARSLAGSATLEASTRFGRSLGRVSCRPHRCGETTGAFAGGKIGARSPYGGPHARVSARRRHVLDPGHGVRWASSPRAARRHRRPLVSNARIDAVALASRRTAPSSRSRPIRWWCGTCVPPRRGARCLSWALTRTCPGFVIVEAQSQDRFDVIATADGKRLTVITSEAKADIPSSASTPSRVERHHRTHDNVDGRRGGARRPRSRRPAKRARADAGSARRDSMAS